jgi:hypothetical protein
MDTLPRSEVITWLFQQKPLDHFFGGEREWRIVRVRMDEEVSYRAVKQKRGNFRFGRTVPRWLSV